MQIATSFSGWFTFGDVPDEVPPSWKQSMIVLLMLYPIVMLELLFLNPLLNSLGMAEVTFIGSLISVVVLVPPANRAFDRGLHPIPNGPRWVTAAGVALIGGLYALMVTVFAWLS